MVIKLNTKTQIMWIILFYCLINFYVLGRESFFLFSLLPIGIYFVRKNAIVIPRIPGLVIYISVLLLATAIGMTKYPISLVERDVFYQFYDFLFLIFGYYTLDYYKGRDKSMWKTICLYLFIVSVVCMAKGVVTIAGGASFLDFRNVFKDESVNISVCLPILLGRRIVYKEVTFSKMKDNIISALWLTQMLLNLGRTAIINFILGLGVFVILGIVSGRLSAKNYFRATLMICAIVGMGAGLILAMPEEITDTLGDKFSNTFSEISSDNVYKNSLEAQQDWRGYEIQCAKKQWSSAKPITQLVGGGNGTLIAIHYMPEHWKDFEQRQNGQLGITLLHNTYYTLLIKAGILGVIALIGWICAFLRTQKHTGKKLEEQDNVVVE